jgi:hypothetical protein
MYNVNIISMEAILTREYHSIVNRVYLFKVYRLHLVNGLHHYIFFL